MALCSPTIVGPLSELSTSIRVQGQAPTSTVTVESIGPNPRAVAKGKVGSSDDRVGLLTGVSLNKMDLLVAVQDFGGQSSDPTNAIPTPVQPAPTSAAQLGHVGYETHLYQCGEALMISGAIPGSLVETSFSGAVQGSGVANEGVARFPLKTRLPATVVSSFQVVKGLSQGPNTDGTPDPIPGPPDASLPAPTIGDPLKACQSTIAVENVFDGATVTVTRSQGPTKSSTFDASSLWFNLSQPLIFGETITVVQAFPKCQRTGAPGGRMVGPPHPVEPPSISGHLCAGTTRVPVAGLIPGAQVHIIVDPNIQPPAPPVAPAVHQGWAPTDTTTYTFDIGDQLPESALVSVQQERCEIFWSDPAPTTVRVDPQEQITVAPVVVGPLWECARNVFVKDVHPNAQLLVFAKPKTGAPSPISNIVTFLDTSGSIAVNPYLHATDEVFVAQWACGNAQLNSQFVLVKANPPPATLTVEGYLPYPLYRGNAIYDGATSVVVVGATPGALIQVYTLAKMFLAQEIGDPSGRTRVKLGRALTTADQIAVRQILCNGSTGFIAASVVPIPNLQDWLAAHRSISDAIIWQSSTGMQRYSSWSPSMKSDLTNAFKTAWNFGSVFPTDPVPNRAVLADNDGVAQIEDETNAWQMFLSYVAQSLVVEIGNSIGWSILGYSSSGLSQLFDSRKTLEWDSGVGGYQGYQDKIGTVLQCAPDFGVRFLFDNQLVGASRVETIGNLIKWCCNTLSHQFGGNATIDFYNVWQYRGFTPVLRMIQGTVDLNNVPYGKQNWTAGCWGTTPFFKEILRIINIPAELIEIVGPAPKFFAHALPHFIEDAVYLSHGDDPYDLITRSLLNQTAMTAPELLISQNQFDTWFGSAVAPADKFTNVARYPSELALKYLPPYLLQQYCIDRANGTPKKTGAVAALFINQQTGVPWYTVSTLDDPNGINLWGRMDAALKAVSGTGTIDGGCKTLFGL